MISHTIQHKVSYITFLVVMNYHPDVVMVIHFVLLVNFWVHPPHSDYIIFAQVCQFHQFKSSFLIILVLLSVLNVPDEKSVRFLINHCKVFVTFT